MISVCMATYNGEKYIDQQLDSILLQLNCDDEVVVSDDGSSDNTRSIVERYAQKYGNIRLIEGPRKGVIKNFENAINNALGDIIFLSDQDDVWVDNKVQSVLKTFDDNNCMLVLHDASIVDENGNLLEPSFFEHRGSKIGLFNNLVKNSYIGCCMAFKKELLPQIMPIPDNIEMHDWWIGIVSELNKGSVMNHEKLINYRRHNSNVSSMHHHPLKKMIYNRCYLFKEMVKRKRRIK